MPDQFPRTTDLPVQSPLFWVEQKDRYLRQLAIRDFEAMTKRKLLVYFANRFEGASIIDAKDSAYMAELLSRVSNGDPVDILLETNGGSTDATEALISLLQNSLTEYRVIVANAAKSNGTLLALSAKSVVMGTVSELGPIDPHIDGTPCTILSRPEVAAMNFPIFVLASNFIQQSAGVATRLLSKGMMRGKPEEEIAETVRALTTNSKYFAHGSVIDYREAQSLGLDVTYLPPTDDLWKRIWLLYCMYDFDCRRNRYLKIFESNTISTAIAAPTVSP